MRRTKADAQLTREALLDAAEALFAERGVSRTSLQDIARAAGVTRGAVYWHFADKAELFNAMMERTTEPMIDTLDHIDPDTDQAPLAALRDSTLQALHRIAHDPRTRRVFDVATHKVEYVDDLLGARTRHLSVHRHCTGRIEASFTRAQALGQVPAHTPPAVLAAGFQALVSGLIQTWMLDDALFDLNTVAVHALDAYLNGLGGLSAA
jgi:TetR/AcrR family acrAB operon transcriptional repressor